MDEHNQNANPDAQARDTRLQYGIASVLLTTTLVALLLAVFRWIPGVGILLIVVVTPAFVRATVIAARAKRLGRRMTIAQKVVAFLAAMGLVVATALACGLAFYVTCWGGFLVSGAAAKSLGATGRMAGWEWALGVGIIAGVIGQIVFLGCFIFWLWRRRGDQRNRLGDIGFILSWAGFAMIYAAATLQLAGKNVYGNDSAGAGLVAIPGLVFCLIALWQPRRVMASIGTGLALASCGVTLVFFSVTKHGLASRTPNSLIALGFAMAIGLIVAIAVPLIIAWRLRQKPSQVIDETPAPDSD